MSCLWLVWTNRILLHRRRKIQLQIHGKHNTRLNKKVVWHHRKCIPIHQGFRHPMSLVALKSHQQRGFLQWEKSTPRTEKKQPGPSVQPQSWKATPSWIVHQSKLVAPFGGGSFTPGSWSKPETVSQPKARRCEAKKATQIKLQPPAIGKFLTSAAVLR